MTDTDFIYWAIIALLEALLGRGYSLEQAVAVLEAGEWPAA